MERGNVQSAVGELVVSSALKRIYSPGYALKSLAVELVALKVTSIETCHCAACWLSALKLSVTEVMVQFNPAYWTIVFGVRVFGWYLFRLAVGTREIPIWFSEAVPIMRTSLLRSRLEEGTAKSSQFVRLVDASGPKGF